MRRVGIVSVGLAVLMSLCAPAFAGTTTTRGAVEVLDARSCVITLSDKTSYQFGKGCDFSKLKVGEKIAIMWKPRGDVRMAVQVFIAS